MAFFRNPLPVVAFFSVLTATAQPSPTDSLLRVLAHATDTAKVNALNQLSKLHWFTDARKTRAYAGQAIALARRLRFEKGVALGYNNLGVGFYLQNDYPNALNAYRAARAANESLGNRKGVGDALNNMGLVFWKQGNYPEAVAHYLQSLRIDEERRDAPGVAASLCNIGNIYDEQGDYPTALAYYFRALKLEATLPKGDVDRGMTLNNIGSAYLNQRRYPQALAYLTRSLTERGEHDREGKAVCLSNIGLAYLGLKQYPKALAYLTQALPIQQELGDAEDLLSTQEGMAQVYRHTGELAKSEAFARRVLAEAGRVEDKKREASAHRLLAELAALQHRYPQAYHHQVSYAQTRDSLLNDERTRQIARLQAAYERQKKETEIALLRGETARSRAVRNLFGVGLLSSVAIGWLVVSRQRLKARKNRQVFEARQALAEAEIEHQRAREAHLSQELDFRNKALTTHTLNLIQKNSIMEEIRQAISLALKTTRRDENSPLFARLIKLIDYSFNLDKDWDEFKLYFEGVHTDFFVKLKAAHADLSAGELRLCALVRLNLNLKEVATLLSISPDSVKTARHRLRKKLALPEDQALADYLIGM